MDVQKAFRNVVQQLQEEPQRYKLYGVYWWPMKAMLKAAGYNQENLYMLGDYQDAETADLVPPMGLEEMMQTAFAEYGQNARFPRPGGVVEDPDGELVTIFDADADL